MNIMNLSNLQKDVLKEIGNIGAGNAATSMSELINKKIGMDVPSVSIVPFDEVMDMIGGPEQPIVAVLFQIEGDISGTVYFILSENEAELLVEQMMPGQMSSAFDDMNDLSISILQEVGNILTGSYITALSDLLNLDIQPSIPHFSVDMAGAILTVGLIELSQATDFALIIDTKINDSDTTNGINGQFFLIPEPEALSTIFQSLGMNNDA